MLMNSSDRFLTLCQALGVVVALSAVSMLGCHREPRFPAGFDPAGSDARAIEVAARAMDAMGGADGWAATRYLAFDFVVEFGGAPPVAYRHYWDTGTGNYRVEGMDEEQRPYLVIFNLHTRQGTSWLDGQPARGQEHARLVQEGYERFINDTYWLIMPLKLFDPGVHLHYEGEVRSDERVRDRVRVSFDPGIGLTPEDVYWLEVDRKSGRVERWEFVLQGDEDKYGYSWTGWQKFGPLTLSTRKESDDGSERFLFLNVIASEQLDPEPFEPPPGPQASTSP
jgi:hypothetical protein